MCSTIFKFKIFNLLNLFLFKALLGPVDTTALGGKAYHAMISIHRVEDLPQSGMVGLYSPFVTVEFGTNVLCTSNGRSVVQYTFNETARIPVLTPVYIFFHFFEIKKIERKFL